VIGDESALVRKAAVAGLERLNSSGANGELSLAFADGDADVRLAALHAATRINAFSDVAAVVALIGDESALVRRRAAETLGVMKAADAVASLLVLAAADQESEGAVRAAAIWALGQIGDPAAHDAILAAQTDTDPAVHAAAHISARLLRI
jgi:HEAT repeat protein